MHTHPATLVQISTPSIESFSASYPEGNPVPNTQGLELARLPLFCVQTLLHAPLRSPFVASRKGALTPEPR